MISPYALTRHGGAQGQAVGLAHSLRALGHEVTVLGPADPEVPVPEEVGDHVVIGQGGALLKQVGRAARLEMEREFGRKVFLQMWVKVRENWSDDARALATLGFEEG